LRQYGAHVAPWCGRRPSGNRNLFMRPIPVGRLGRRAFAGLAIEVSFTLYDAQNKRLVGLDDFTTQFDRARDVTARRKA